MRRCIHELSTDLWLTEDEVKANIEGLLRCVGCHFGVSCRCWQAHGKENLQLVSLTLPCNFTGFDILL